MSREKYLSNVVSSILNEDTGYTTYHDPKFSKQEKQIYDYINKIDNINKLQKLVRTANMKIERLSGDENESTNMGQKA